MVVTGLRSMWGVDAPHEFPIGIHHGVTDGPKSSGGSSLYDNYCCMESCILTQRRTLALRLYLLPQRVQAGGRICSSEARLDLH